MTVHIDSPELVIVSDMTYNAFGRTLNPTLLSLYLSLMQRELPMTEVYTWTTAMQYALYHTRAASRPYVINALSSLGHQRRRLMYRIW